MKRVIIVIALFTVASASFAAGTGESDPGSPPASQEATAPEAIPEIATIPLEEGEKLAVVATTSILGDVVAEVGGDAIDLTVLIPVGQNPHAYEPTPRAIASIETADIVFTNGFDLEENLLSIVNATARGPVVSASSGIGPHGNGSHRAGGHSHGDDHDEEPAHDSAGHNEDHAEDDHPDDHDHGEIDPHVWFDPTNAIVWVDNIEAVLAAADPANAEGYAARAARYRESLEELDDEYRRRLSEIPRERRKLVVDHAALGYLADEYDLTVIGSVIPAVTDQAEPSARQIAELVEVIRDEGVSTIFIGGTAGDGLRNLANAVAEETGSPVTIRTLLTGSLAPRGSRGDTYIAFLRYNLEQIAEGLSQ
ncbi:MAG: metal ABC transporter substrate-binding protein [Alkalispirochaeta sp.]